MSDSVSWCLAMREFREWARKATDEELGQWLVDTDPAKFAYRDEIPVVEAELRRRDKAQDGE